MKSKARIASVAGALALTVAPAALAADLAPPLVTNLHVVHSGRELSFSVSEYSLVHVVVRRVAAGGTVRVGSLQAAFMPGAARLPINRVRGKALQRGRYVVTVTANDVAQNRAPAQMVRFRIR